MFRCCIQKSTEFIFGESIETPTKPFHLQLNADEKQYLYLIKLGLSHWKYRQVSFI